MLALVGDHQQLPPHCSVPLLEGYPHCLCTTMSGWLDCHSIFIGKLPHILEELDLTMLTYTPLQRPLLDKFDLILRLPEPE